MTLKSFFGYYFAKYIVKKNNTWINAAVSTQNKQRKFILDNAKNTKFGKDHGFSKILNYTDWKKSVPIRDYEGLKPYIDLVVNGENDISCGLENLFIFAKLLAQLLEVSIFLLVSNL